MAGNNADGVLLSIVNRIESIKEEIAVLRNDEKEIRLEAKSGGFDMKIINELLKERRLSAAEQAERLEMLDVYRNALGMLTGTPLGDAATRKFSEKINPETGEVTQAL